MSTFMQSISFALNGIQKGFSKEKHFKVHSFFAVVVIISGIFFNVSTNEWVLLLICIGTVVSAELINTAIEELCNIICTEAHPGIKLVKDLAAAAVLVVVVSAAISGLVIFIPKIISFLEKI